MVDVTPQQEPVLEATATSGEPVTFQLIMDTWAKEGDHRHIYDDVGAMVTRNETRDNWEVVIRHLQGFLGHDDPGRIIDKDANRWLDHLLHGPD
jgi:hypothetical protein